MASSKAFQLAMTLESYAEHLRKAGDELIRLQSQKEMLIAALREMLASCKNYTTIPDARKVAQAILDKVEGDGN